MIVRFHSMLSHYGEIKILISLENITISKLLKQLKVNQGEIGVILINGQLSSFEAALLDEDRVDFYPIFGGG